jgi:hypothetical protein
MVEFSSDCPVLRVHKHHQWSHVGGQVSTESSLRNIYLLCSFAVDIPARRPPRAQKVTPIQFLPLLQTLILRCTGLQPTTPQVEYFLSFDVGSYRVSGSIDTLSYWPTLRHVADMLRMTNKHDQNDATLSRESTIMDYRFGYLPAQHHSTLCLQHLVDERKIGKVY